MDRLAYALAANALEPGDALALERARVRPGLSARLDHARRALDAEEAPTGPWLVGDVGQVMLGALHLDAGAWRGGDRLPVELGGDLPAEARLRVTVHTRAGTRVLSPVEDQWVRLGQLRRTEADRWALDLVLEEVPGLHRVEVEVLAAEGEQILARAEVAVRVG